jgi:hypothetical protein
MALFDKPAAGTGASLLVKVFALILTGEEPPIDTAPTRDEEWEKVITALLIAGRTFITLDNVTTTLDHPKLAATLTSGTWSGRVLGRSVNVIVPQRATWSATGNNLRLGEEMARRCYWINQDARIEFPNSRTGWLHPDLPRWVRETRGALVAAVLTLARHWVALGQPPGAGVPVFGGFEDWSRVVGGILAAAGFTHFLGNADEMRAEANADHAAWVRLLAVWHEKFDTAPVGVADLMKATEPQWVRKGPPGSLECEENTTFRDAVRDACPKLDIKDKYFAAHLGRQIGYRKNCVFGAWRVVRESVDRHVKSNRWQLEPAGRASSASGGGSE